MEAGMSADRDKKHWVFRVGVADRAGALTSIASAFSNRGISIDTVVGHGAPHPAAHDGTVVVTFWCTEAEKELIVRVVRELSKVTDLQEHPYDSESLRKSALVHVSRRLRPRDMAGRETFLTCELMREERGIFTYFIAGSPSELDPIISRFVQEGILADIVYSVVGL
jgi:acetolactate synthase small subunit